MDAYETLSNLNLFCFAFAQCYDSFILYLFTVSLQKKIRHLVKHLAHLKGACFFFYESLTLVIIRSCLK